MAYNMGGRRFRPVGSGKKRTAPQYGPVGTGCPFVEEAVARLYREQNEEHFWSLMNALNYALELQTKVLVPLDAAVDPQSGAAPWAHLPIPEDRAEGLPPWLLRIAGVVLLIKALLDKPTRWENFMPAVVAFALSLLIGWIF